MGQGMGRMRLTPKDPFMLPTPTKAGITRQASGPFAVIWSLVVGGAHQELVAFGKRLLECCGVC